MNMQSKLKKIENNNALKILNKLFNLRLETNMVEKNLLMDQVFSILMHKFHGQTWFNSFKASLPKIIFNSSKVIKIYK